MKNLYSLWIIPSSSLKKSLDEIILKLAEKYKSPKFEAHMTLLGDIDSDEETIIQKTKRFASKIKTFPLELGEISFSTTYFQSVFVRVKSTAKLLDANLKAKRIFRMDNNVFMPHISLLYGNHGMILREKIVSEIELSKTKDFKADNIIIVPSTNNPNEWKHLAKIPFQY
jgi:2'-5' RNA ligase